MDIEELRNLIPDYVANRLDGTERKVVEDALPRSEELRKELEFWARLKAATRAQAEYLSEGHLTPEQIVEYVEGNDIHEMLAHEKHLQACGACRREVELIRQAPTRQTFEQDEPGAIHAQKSWMRSLSALFRPAFAVPAALAVAVLLYFFLQPKVRIVPPQGAEEAERADSTKSPLAAIAPQPKGVAHLLLYPQLGLRATSGAERESLLHYDTAKSLVALSLVVPRSDVTLGYNATLSSPSGASVHIQDSVISFARGAISDTVKTQIAMPSFANEEGRWRLWLTEILKPEAKGRLEEETIEFEFRVKKK